MAKSIRSKHRRRMRSVKRDAFGAKNLIKLKATVMRDVVNQKNADTEMEDIVTVKTAADLKGKQSNDPDGTIEMKSGPSKDFDKKKKTDEHGQYPEWMNQRAMRKQQQKNKKSKVKRGKGKKASAW